jgi:DNA-binding transcriptional LysR family regulator
MDRLASMRAYCTVVELGSFTRAAERLGMANSMVTRHVSSLEDCLGVRLLNRTTRKLSRTEAGQAYYERARELLAEIDELNASLGERNDTPRGLVRVTAPTSFGVQYLGSAIASFAARYPEVRIDLGLSDRVVDVVEEGWDLAIRIARLVDSSLVARRISQTRMAACAAPAYLQAQGTPAHPAQLGRHRCLSYTYASGGDSWTVTGAAGEVSVRIPWTVRANNGDLLRTAALEGAGVVLLPTFIVAPDLAAGRLVEVLGDYGFGTLGIHAVYPHRRHLSLKVRALVDHLQEVLPASL